MTALKPAAILVIGFLLGAALMGVEMAAIRMMTPYFGSAIEIWACMIATVMLSMMAGVPASEIEAFSINVVPVLTTSIRTRRCSPPSKIRLLFSSSSRALNRAASRVAASAANVK